MSMNPARTFGSALFAQNFAGLWSYFTAPPLGMLLAAELFVHRMGLERANVSLVTNARVTRLLTSASGREVTGVAVDRGGREEIFSGQSRVDRILERIGATTAARVGVA
jgi:Major intrinsic protein